MAFAGRTPETRTHGLNYDSRAPSQEDRGRDGRDDIVEQIDIRPNRTPENRNMFANVKSREDIDNVILNLNEAIKRSEGSYSHQEIYRVYEYGKRSDVEVIQEELFLKAFKEAGSPELHLGYAKLLKEDEQIDFGAIRNKKGPQIFVKQVYEIEDNRNAWDKLKDTYNAIRAHSNGMAFESTSPKIQRKPTKQVLVTISLNNGKNPDNNTVITGVFHYENNKIDMNSESQMDLSSEADYHAKFLPADEKTVLGSNSEIRTVSTYYFNSPGAKLARGELTLEQYNKEFLDTNGITPDEFWKRRDQALEVDLHTAESDRYRGDLMDRLVNSYYEDLQQAQERKDQLAAEVVRRAFETQRRNKEIMNSEYFGWLSRELARDPTSENVEMIKRLLLASMRRYFTDDAEADQLLEELLAKGKH
ncbi:hypothetical protein A2415_05495 [candidate division WWE3 bacterium RIFOXYC1_FULL_39_7]|uniref:Uncharacterized protein n=1 Tax=candidate division WWE3 bacterium RIFOXYC1_FULL_39_7 TaxID=1802643 RepID=A0A1F4WGS6_UNCKA|nr:MAG: hypothetical protein A2415_05495 [candidate division WWE3 bacterium RIFOXYC1_FULL_39_7]